MWLLIPSLTKEEIREEYSREVLQSSVTWLELASIGGVTWHICANVIRGLQLLWLQFSGYRLILWSTWNSIFIYILYFCYIHQLLPGGLLGFVSKTNISSLFMHSYPWDLEDKLEDRGVFSVLVCFFLLLLTWTLTLLPPLFVSVHKSTKD